MDWLNYHHLLYFWIVAREGTLAAAGQRLHLSASTLSTQINALEKSLGVQFFERVGRKMQLTETGRVALRYADDIFSSGRAFVDAVKGRSGSPLRLHVGVVDVVPKLIAYRLLAPVLNQSSVGWTCLEGKIDGLLARLNSHELDLVISDAPIPSNVNIRAFNHPLGQCGVSIFAAKRAAARLRKRFPASLNDAPWLLPTGNNSLRRSLDRWFDAHHIRPHVVGEFEDSALLKVFGQQGLGCFAGPTAIELEICRQYQVSVIGRADIREQFFAITMQRRFAHAAVQALVESARSDLLRSSCETQSGATAGRRRTVC